MRKFSSRIICLSIISLFFLISGCYAMNPEKQKAYKRKPLDFSIGMVEGTTPWNLRPIPGVHNPVFRNVNVTGMLTRFVADPFMVREKDRWYMFFEAVDQLERKGKIGLAESKDGLRWKYRQVVLTETCHLSYPYVFKWQDQYYMIPETFSKKAIRLYRAVDFPTKWEYVQDLIEGPYADSSIVRFNGRWWIITADPRGNRKMYVFFARDLTGPWYDHPLNPIYINNQHFARPGGRIIFDEGKLYRFAQDDYKLYGNKLWAFQITELSTTGYAEKLTPNNPILKASGKGWNALGMHQLDIHRVSKDRWIGCVDGRK